MDDSYANLGRSINSNRFIKESQYSKGTSINSDFFVIARKHRAENRSVYEIREDLSTVLTQQSRKKQLIEVPVSDATLFLHAPDQLNG